MIRKFIVPIIVLLCCLALYSASIAQEETPEAPVTVTGDNPVITNDNPDVTVTGDDTTIVNTGTPDILVPLLALAGSVFSIMQMLKNAGLSTWVKDTFKEDRRQELVYWLIASLIAFLILVVTESDLDALGIILNLKPPSTEVARVVRLVVTAIVAGGGNAFIHLLYDALWRLAVTSKPQTPIITSP
jgi:hypothetical protein